MDCRDGPSLKELHRRIISCRSCSLHKSRTHAVPGEGPSDARIFLVGEAPGRVEDRTGRPFVGPSGLLLSQMLAQAGLNREELFITSVVKCRPPANRTPKREEWETCLRLYLMPQLNIVGPRVVGLLGLTAAKALLGVSRLEDVRGKVFEDDGLVFLPTFHPAAAGRNPQWRRMLETDLLRLARLGAGRSR